MISASTILCKPSRQDFSRPVPNVGIYARFITLVIQYRLNNPYATMSTKQLMIVDCDCGVDDALALFLALAYKETWRILAITCCHGNTTVDNVCDNVRKVLQLCGETEIPVYRGCDRALVKTADLRLVHGNDGFGNMAQEYPHDQINIEKEHAINALVTLAKRHSQEGVHLVVLGPMTNVAMAHRYDPEFTKNLKSIHFMGGNIHGVGNTTSSAEFNFACDPEAANIVLTEFKCPMTMVPWETTAKHYMSWDAYEGLFSSKTVRSQFLQRITKSRLELCKRRGNLGFVDCDFLPMAALIRQDAVHKISKNILSVQRNGRVISESLSSQDEEVNFKTKNKVTVIVQLHNSILEQMRMLLVQESRS